MDKKLINEFVDAVFNEALSAGDRNTTQGNDNSAPGQTTWQMLSGEFFGSPIWPYQQASNPDLAGSTAFQAQHANAGLGELIHEVTESVLETDLSFYSDPNSVGFLINSLAEFGYPEYSKIVSTMTETPLEEKDSAKLVEMASDLEKSGAPADLVEQVKGLSEVVKEMLTEEDGGRDAPVGNPTDSTAAEMPNDDDPSSVDSKVSTVEPEV